MSTTSSTLVARNDTTEGIYLVLAGPAFNPESPDNQWAIAQAKEILAYMADAEPMVLTRKLKYQPGTPSLVPTITNDNNVVVDCVLRNEDGGVTKELPVTISVNLPGVDIAAEKVVATLVQDAADGCSFWGVMYDTFRDSINRR